MVKLFRAIRELDMEIVQINVWDPTIRKLVLIRPWSDPNENPA